MNKPLLGLSGGINSMAVLCWLIEQYNRPNDICIFYAHFKEHSPDTFQFVADGIRLARKHFNVHVKITSNSIIDYFASEKFIPHPKVSPCSEHLKFEIAEKWAFEMGCDVDLIGYVKHELKRRTQKAKGNAKNKFEQTKMFEAVKQYPIGEFTDEWCFNIVHKYIGWYPKIYDILYTIDDYNNNLCQKWQIGKRVFLHNNCLPCKNMDNNGIANVKRYYPEYYYKAMQLSAYLGSYWGRDEDDFYFRFGRDLGQDSTCEKCKW